MAFESVAGNHTRHWALAVGIEGGMCGRQHVPDTILLLDPGGIEPHFSVANARLRLHTVSGSRKPLSVQKVRRTEYDYESGSWPTERVRLLSAVRIKPGTWS